MVPDVTDTTAHPTMASWTDQVLRLDSNCPSNNNREQQFFKTTDRSRVRMPGGLAKGAMRRTSAWLDPGPVHWCSFAHHHHNFHQLNSLIGAEVLQRTRLCSASVFPQAPRFEPENDHTLIPIFQRSVLTSFDCCRRTRPIDGRWLNGFAFYRPLFPDGPSAESHMCWSALDQPDTSYIVCNRTSPGARQGCRVVIWYANSSLISDVRSLDYSSWKSRPAAAEAYSRQVSGHVQES